MSEPGRKKEVGGVILLCSLLFVWTLAPLQGYDLWFYLSVARRLLESGSIPWSESFLGTTSVHAFGKYANHAWLSHLFIYLFYLAGGTVGLVVSRSVLLTSIAFFTYLNCRLLGLAPWPSALWVTLGLWTVRSRFLLRTYHFTDLALALTLTALLYFGGKDRPRLLALFSLFCLWSNLHQGVIAGWVLLFLWTLGGGLSWRQGAAALAVAVVASLIRPHGWTYPRFLYDHFANESAVSGVLEWGPLSPEGLVVHLGPFLLLAVALSLWGRARNEWPERIPWHHLLVSGAFLLLALRSQRAVAEILPVVFPLLVVFFPKRMVDRRMKVGSLLVLAGLLLYTNPLNSWSSLSQLYPRYPVQLTERLKGRQGQVFNSYEWGAYLGFAGVPPFIHGTTALFREQLVEDFQTILNASPRGIELLDRYQVTDALLHYPTDVDATDLLIRYLHTSPDWKLECWDDSGVLFTRAADAAALTAVQPWVKPSWTDASAARAELEELVRDTPSARAHLMLSELASLRGDWEESARQARLALLQMPYAYHGWQALGVASAKLGDVEATLKASEEALRWGPDRPRAHFNRALVLINGGQPSGPLEQWWVRRQIRRHLERTLELDPDFEPARRLLESLD